MESIGPYQITGELGRGGMGVVYRAQDTRVGRPVALKVVLSDGLTGDALRRFQVEAQAVGRLRHPGIVAVHDLGEHQGRPVLVMGRCARSTACATAAS